MACLLTTAALAADPPAPLRGDWPMWGGTPSRNMVSGETGIPTEWNVKTGKNIMWRSPLGSQSYGNPTVAGGHVYVGTNNDGNHRPGITGDKGVVLCIDAEDGKLLWQATHDKLPTGRVNDWPEQGICSTAAVDGDRVYYVSNRCQLVCADVNGFLDGKNDGIQDEQYHDKMDADFIWIVDMYEDLEVFPHNLATSSPVIAGDLVYVCTSNGVDEGHINIPSPDAPSFIAVNKNDGKVVWEAFEPGKKILHGQWSSPAYGVMGGKPQVIFGAGDGWVYSYEAKTGKVIWKFDANPKDAVYKLGGRGTKNEIISTPVIFDDRVFVCVGQDPEHGEGIGHLYCIDGTKTGDVTESGRVWHLGGDDFHRSMSTCAIHDGLMYDADLSGFLYCLDVKTGKVLWKHDTFAAIWGSPYVVDGKVMLGDEEGNVSVFAEGKTKKKLATNDMGNSVYSTPVAANGMLYAANRRMLFAIKEGASSPPPAEEKAASR